jgi:hypothetical protein
MYVLEASCQKPQESFVFHSKISALTDRWAIDGTVLQMSTGELWFLLASPGGDL